MAKSRKDFSDILIGKGKLSPSQKEEAVGVARSRGIKLAEALVQLGYVTTKEVMSAVAEEHRMEFVDLDEVQIPKSVIELVPESVARENVVIPLGRDERSAQSHHSATPTDLGIIDKLRFILNQEIELVLAPREADHPGDQPALRAVGNPVGRLDAPGVHRNGNRIHRSRRRSGCRTNRTPRSSSW